MNAMQFETARRAYTLWTIEQAAKLGSALGFGYEEAAEAPDTYEKVCSEFHACKRRDRQSFRVWSGACDQTVFTTPEGNYAFRFCHDVLHHAIAGFEFSFDDEVSSGMEWVKAVANEFGADSLEAAIAYADTVGQSTHAHQTGAFPVNQLAFVQAEVSRIKGAPAH